MFESLIHVSQVTKNDCGIACIDMILKYYGYDENYTDIRKSLYITDKGLSIQNMVNYFHKRNIKTKLYKVNNNKIKIYNFININAPIIGLLNDKDSYHYVVIYKVRHGKIKYSDPCEKNIKNEKNIDFFNKLDLLIFPVIKKRKHMTLKNNFIFSNIYNERKNIVRISLVIFLASAIGILLSSQFGLFIDALTNAKQNIFFNQMVILLILFIILNVFNCYLNGIENMMCLRTIKRIENNISKKLVEQILYQEVYDLNQYSVGEITSRVNDCVTVSMTIAKFFLTILPDICISALGIVILFYINWKLSILFIVSLFFCGLLMIITYKKVYELEHNNAMLYSDYYSQLIDIIRGFLTIKSLRSEEYFKCKTFKLFDDYTNGSLRKETYITKISILQTLFVTYANLLILFFGIIMVEKNILSLGNLVIFSSITGLIENIFTRSINFQFDLENFIVSYNRLTQLFIQRKKDKINNDRNEIEIITLKNVNISYGEIKVLENISLKIEDKYTIINGKSGTGKTSFAKVLSGLENHYVGKIAVNNSNPDKYFNSIVYISNNSDIFEGTIRDNLCNGKIILDSYLKKVCKDFCVDKIIKQKNIGLDYKIVSNQTNLSTGEKQRIALARAVLSNPAVLILDEALSNIDIENKRIILNNIKNYDFKLIIISHEKYTFPDCKYLLFENNTVKEVKKSNESRIVKQ